MRRQARQGDKGAHSEHREHNPRRDGRNNREERSLNPEGPGPKAFEINVCQTCFPKHFPTPNNVVKYDGKKNPSVWLQDYHFVCGAGRMMTSS
jgi:hypothetical protein